MKAEVKVATPWTAAHQAMLSRLLQGLDALGATYHVKAGGVSHGTLRVHLESTRPRVNNFVKKYDYIKTIAGFNGGTLELVAEPGEAEKLRAVALSALAKKFEAGAYTTTVEGNLITIVAYGIKNAAAQGELAHV